MADAGISENIRKEVAARYMRIQVVQQELDQREAVDHVWKDSLKTFMHSPTMIVTAAASAISVIYGLVKAHSQAMTEMTDNAKEALDGANSAASSRKEVSELARSYVRLSNQTKLSDEETEKFTETQNKLKELMPELSGYYDEQGDFIIKNVNSLNDLNAEYEKYLAHKREEAATAYTTGSFSTLGRSQFDIDTRNYKDAEAKITAIEDVLEELNNVDNSVELYQAISGSTKDMYDAISKGYEGNGSAESLFQFFNEQLNTEKAKMDKVLEDVADQAINRLATSPTWYEFGESARNAIREGMIGNGFDFMSEIIANEDSTNVASTIQNLFDSLSNDVSFKVNFQDNVNGLKDRVTGIMGGLNGLNGEELTDFGAATSRYGLEQLTDKGYVDAYTNLTKAAAEYDLTMNEMVDVLVELGMVHATVSEQVKNSAADWEPLNNSIDKIQSTYKSAQEAAAEYNKYGYVSLDTLQELVQLDSQYLSVLIDENGQLKLNGNTYQQLIAVMLDKAKAEAITQAISELSKVTKEEDTQVSLKAVEANEILSQSLALVGGSYEYVAKSAEYSSQAQALAAAIMDASGKNHAKTQQIVSNLNAKLALIEKTGLNVGKSFGGMNNAVNGFSDAAKSAADAAKKANEELQEMLEKEQQLLKLYGDAMVKEIDNRIDALNKEIDALDDLYDAEDREFELQKAKDAYEAAKNNKVNRVYDENEGWVWRADESAMREAGESLSDLERGYAREDAKKAIEDQIQALEELKEQWNETLSLLGQDWDEYVKSLEYAAEVQKMSMEQMATAIPAFRDNVLANMQAIYEAQQEAKRLEEETSASSTQSLGTLAATMGGIAENTSSVLNNMRSAINEAKQALDNLSSDASMGQTISAWQNLISTIVDYIRYMEDSGATNKEIEEAISELAETYGVRTEDISKALEDEKKASEDASTAVKSGIDGIGKAQSDLLDKMKGDFVPGMSIQFADFARVAGNHLDTITSKINGVNTAMSRSGSFNMGAYFKNASGTKSVQRTRAFRSGIRSLVDEAGAEIVVRGNEGRFTTLEIGDGVVPHNLTNTLFSAAINPTQFIMNRMAGIMSGMKVKTGAPISGGTTISMGDIILNDVNDANSLAREITARFGNAMLQETTKKR